METLDAWLPLQEQLGSGEHLLWTGQPRRGILLRGADTVLVPFSFVWGGFAMFWEWSVINSDGPFILKLWGIPFVLMGLYLIVGRFFWDAYQRRHTHYGLTNQRVMILTTQPRTRVRSVNLQGLGDTALSTGADGRGTLVFGTAGPGVPPWFVASGWPGLNGGRAAFDLIDDPQRVQELIRQAQETAR